MKLNNWADCEHVLNVKENEKIYAHAIHYEGGIHLS